MSDIFQTICGNHILREKGWIPVGSCKYYNPKYGEDVFFTWAEALTFEGNKHLLNACELETLGETQ